MGLRETARYEFGLSFALIIPSNYDKTIPTPDRITGGVGPFDFSGASTPGAVPLSIRLDTDAVMTFNLNVTVGAANIAAVTVQELVDMINAAGFVDITASVEAVTGYLLIQYTGTDVYTFMQVYGLAAQLAEIGQGRGCKFIRCNTFKTHENTPEINASETIETEDAEMKKTSIITDSYRKGCTGTITDTALDFELRAIIEGGTYAAATGYETPTQDSQKIYFVMYIFTRLYEQGENFYGDIVGYLMKTFRKCMADFGAKTAGKQWAEDVFPFRCVTYKDENGDRSGDTNELVLGIDDYEALDVENL